MTRNLAALLTGLVLAAAGCGGNNTVGNACPAATAPVASSGCPKSLIGAGDAVTIFGSNLGGAKGVTITVGGAMATNVSGDDQSIQFSTPALAANVTVADIIFVFPTCSTVVCPAVPVTH